MILGHTTITATRSKKGATISFRKCVVSRKCDIWNVQSIVCFEWNAREATRWFFFLFFFSFVFEAWKILLKEKYWWWLKPVHINVMLFEGRCGAGKVYQRRMFPQPTQQRIRGLPRKLTANPFNRIQLIQLPYSFNIFIVQFNNNYPTALDNRTAIGELEKSAAKNPSKSI